METQEIISKLETFDGTFPKEALEAAIKKREGITPVLLDSLDNVIRNAERFSKYGDYILHTHSLYLLAQFREIQAYPLIYKFFSLPFSTLERLIGDAHIEQAGRMLASVCDDDLSLIKELIENPDIDEYPRTFIFDALIVLMVNGVLSREEVIEYLIELFDGKLEQKKAFIWNGLISTCLDLNAFELMDRIKIAFSNN